MTIYTDPWSPTILSPIPTSPVFGGTLGMPPLTASMFPSKDEHNSKVYVGTIVNKGYWIKATGSRVTESGWTEDSDWDYVIFDPDIKLEDELMVEGWELGGSGEEGALSNRAFSSLKKLNTNFILVSDEDQWKKWIVATNLLKALNPETKEERIKLFDTVFGDTPDSKAMEF